MSGIGSHSHTAENNAISATEAVAYVTIWSNKYLRTEAKVRIYKSVVRPTLTYAAETRTDTAKTRQLLEVTEMKTRRRIINKTKWDRVRNARIRE